MNTATGHSLQHGPTKSSEFIAAADVSAKALYWSFCENKFETPPSLVQWKNAASSWHITGQQVPSNTFWRTLLDKTLPKDVFNTNYELGHYLIPLRPAGQKRTLCRHCHLCLETPEHIVVHCTKIGKLLWPAIWRALARLGCTPTTHDEGTLILSLGLLPGSAAATVLAFARSTIHSSFSTPTAVKALHKAGPKLVYPTWRPLSNTLSGNASSGLDGVLPIPLPIHADA